MIMRAKLHNLYVELKAFRDYLEAEQDNDKRLFLASLPISVLTLGNLRTPLGNPHGWPLPSVSLLFSGNTVLRHYPWLPLANPANFCENNCLSHPCQLD